MEIKVLQNWKGKYNLLSNNEELSFVVAIFGEENKIIEVDGIEKVREPLWTTEDGVGVYEGDDVAWVINGEFAYTLTISTGHTNGSLKDSETYKVFSTVEKAIEYVESIKTPILITSDGVELFMGDNYYTVYTMDDKRYNTWVTQNIPFTVNVGKDDYLHDGVKYFAEKENAKKYIKENQKRYSLNDIKKIVKKLDCFGTTLIQYLEDGEL